MLSKHTLEEVQTSRCRFQNFGFCKFREKCSFRHVQNVCQNQTCDQKTCLARHPKKCKYFIKKKCKFGEKCQFSHKLNSSSSENETNKLKDLIEEKEKRLDEVKIESNNTKNELLETKEKLGQAQDINEKLIRDIQVLNSKLMVLVPGAVEIENEELKETLAVLNTVIDIYKQAEIESESDMMNIENADNDDGNQAASRDLFKCEDCGYQSNSKRGLNVHVGKLHKT